MTVKDEDGNDITEFRTECPWLSVGDNVSKVKELLDHYEAGHLYLPGGIADQPVSYIRAIKKMRGALNKAKAERAEQIQAEMKAKR